MKQHLVSIVLIVLALTVGSVIGATGTPETVTLVTLATGANEVNAGGVPNQGDPDGRGTASFTANPVTGQFCWDITVTGIDLPATVTHIHRGAAGANGPVVIDLVAPNAAGRSTGCATVTIALLNEIIANPAGFYLNVHNAAFPPGAVRGQLTLPQSIVTLTTYADGANEVNAAGQRGQGDPDGVGSGTFTADPNNGQWCYDVSVTRIALPASGMHIHRGAAGVNGPIVINMTPPNADGRASGCVTVEVALLNQIIANPAGYYLNVHNSEFPPGAVRGQLRVPSAGRISAFTDGRIDGAFIYPVFARAEGIEVYDASGALLLRVTAAQVDAVQAGATNQVIAQSRTGFVAVYRLSSGEIQINIGPDTEGKVEVYIFDKLPATEARRADFQAGA